MEKGSIVMLFQAEIRKIQNYKLQAPNIKQIPMTKIQNSKPSMFWSLDIGVCDLFVIWCLLFGI
jgi:hypothetical protein